MCSDSATSSAVHSRGSRSSALASCRAFRILYLPRPNGRIYRAPKLNIVSMVRIFKPFSEEMLQPTENTANKVCDADPCVVVQYPGHGIPPNPCKRETAVLFHSKVFPS